jgi:hypothetical protein
MTDMPNKKRRCRTQRLREAAQVVADTLEDFPMTCADMGGVHEHGECDRDYSVTWKSSGGEYQVECKMFQAGEKTYTCCIMQEATSSIEVPDLPTTWPPDNLQKQNCPCDQRAFDTAQLECGHIFHPVALAFHFLVTDMRCPMCRSGTLEKMNIECVPESIRAVFAAKIELLKMTQSEENTTFLTPLPTVDVLSNIELEMRMTNGRSSTVRTRVVFNEQHVEDIQRAAMQVTHSTNQTNMLTTGLGVHRSFQRLIRCVVQRQHTLNSDAQIQFALTHPLVPVAIASEPITVSEAWSKLFNPDEMQEESGSVSLFSPGVGGSHAVACINSKYNAHMQAPEITIDVNMHLLINISTYVHEILESIRHNIQENNMYTSGDVIEVTMSSVNGISWASTLDDVVAVTTSSDFEIQ